MKQPSGYDDGSGRICKLQRSLYGLKQAPRCWNIKFMEILNNFDLKVSDADPCVFVSKSNGKVKLILSIYVDDGLIAAESEIVANSLLEGIKNFIEIKHGNLEYYLGFQIRKTEEGIFINQQNYAQKILKKFEMENCRPVAVPMTEYPDIDIDEEILHDVPYREAVGSLIYLSIGTRPDIAFSVGYVSRFLDKPNKKLWLIVKRIFRYIKGTLEYGIFFSKNVDLTLIGFSDADYASDPIDRKSVTGFLFKLNGPIVWNSKKQISVSVSTTESEYVALSEATKDIIWIQRFLETLKIKSSPALIWGDNQAAIKLVKNPEFHKRTKHIDVKYHFIREAYKKNIIEVQYIDTKEQEADILTKPLTRTKFEILRLKIGVVKL